MSLRQKRLENARAIAEGQFITKTLKNQGKEIEIDIDKAMSGFRTAAFFDREFKVIDNKLEYRHKKINRFVDMRTRETKSKGKIRKKRHIVHNRIIYGHLNDIARELMYGFSDAYVMNVKKLED
jgi:hypothetical protein